MKRIYLTGKRGVGKYTLVSHIDYPYLSQFKMYVDTTGYVAMYIPKIGTIRLHKFLMKPDKGLVIDHINRNKLDNRRANLRITTYSVNTRNAKLSVINKSGFKNVYFCLKRNLWIAQIRLNSKAVNLGGFPKAHYAAMAHDMWAKFYFGDDADTNFKSI